MLQRLIKNVHCNNFVSNERLSILVLHNLHIANSDRATIVVDAPTVLLYAVDAVGIGADIVDVHHHYRVVRIDIDVINVIRRTLEIVTVDALDETLAFLSLLLEINLSAILPFGIHHHGVVLL